MSQNAIRDALEAALDAIAPALDTAHGNEAYTPVTGRPYQEVHVMFAAPGNPTMGDGFYQELGVLQVTLMYPPGEGSAAAAARAALIRQAFRRGATFAGSGGITVQVDKTPEASGGSVDGDRWRVVVRAPFHADINT
jgi:hypothetical protein